MVEAKRFAMPASCRLLGLAQRQGFPGLLRERGQDLHRALQGLICVLVLITAASLQVSAAEPNKDQVIKALRAELAEAQEARDKLEAQLEHTRGEIAKSLEELFASTTWKTDPEVVVLRGKLEAAGKQIALLTTAAEGSKSEAAAAKDALASANGKIEALAADAKARKELEAKLDKAETAAADAAGLRSALRQSRLQTDELEAKTGSLGKERDALKTELKTVRDQVAKRVEQVFAQSAKAAKKETDALRAQLEASKAETVKLQATRRAAENTQKQLKAELAAQAKAKSLLEDKAAAAEIARKRATGRVEELSQGQDDLRRLLKAASVNTKAKATELTGLQEEISGLRQESLDAKQLIATLTAENKSLQNERDALFQERVALSKQVAQTKSQVASARAKAESAAKVAARAVRASAGEAAALQEQLTASKRMLEQVKAELATAQARARNAGEDNYKRIEELIVAAAASPGVELDDLKQKLAMAEEEIARLSAALDKKTTQ